MIYLNNAASAWPRAPGVIEAVQQVLTEPPAHPGRAVTRTLNCIVECRQRLAALLAVDDPQRIALTMHATHALNLAILGLDMPRGARVITSVTEHNSVLRPLYHLRERAGIELVIVGLDADGHIDREAWQRALAPGAALAVLNHASNVSGRVNDVAPLFAAAHAAGAVTLLDASQSLGHIPVHPRALGADLVAFTGHKGLRGPAGTGGLYVRPGLELAQYFVGGTGIHSDLHHHPVDMPMRLEAGTPNVPAIAGLTAALRWHADEGDACRRREVAITRLLRDGLRAIPRIYLLDDRDDDDHLGIISLTIADRDLDEIGFILAESFDITCRTGLHCAPLIHAALGSAPSGTIRLSPSGDTTEAETMATLAALRTIVA